MYIYTAREKYTFIPMCWFHLLCSTVSFAVGVYVGTKIDVVNFLTNIPRRQPVADEPEKAAGGGEKKGWSLWATKELETKND